MSELSLVKSVRRPPNKTTQGSAKKIKGSVDAQWIGPTESDGQLMNIESPNMIKHVCFGSLAGLKHRQLMTTGCQWPTGKDVAY